jgi:hypothetical protein
MWAGHGVAKNTEVNFGWLAALSSPGQSQARRRVCTPDLFVCLRILVPIFYVGRPTTHH